MTEKRFELNDMGNGVEDIFNGEKFNICECCDKMNEQELRIDKLENQVIVLNKKQNKTLVGQIKQLKKENEQLKQEIKDIEKVKDGFYDKVFILINQFIEYNQLKVGNHDDVVDNLRELRKELKGDVE